jgi:hypothetical protein
LLIQGFVMGSRQRRKRGTTKGTGSPDPTKDRGCHEAKRGVKKTALQELSGELPTDGDLENYTQYIKDESDRGSAVMAAALVERALEDAIRSHLAAPEDGSQDTWFQGINAPFRTFAAKIALGRALAIYGEHMERRLNVIKNVRNAFAHRMIPLDFSHPTLVEECLSLSPDPEGQKSIHRKVIFAASCMALARVLGDHAAKQGGTELNLSFP